MGEIGGNSPPTQKGIAANCAASTPNNTAHTPANAIREAATTLNADKDSPCILSILTNKMLKIVP